MSRVKALYDFSGEPNTSELTILAGDVLTITRTDVGEGWWEGCNSAGKTGLFPAAYVEVMPMGPPQQPVPPPPPAAALANAPPTARYDPTADEDAEWDDDDWDDDGDTYSEIGPGAGGARGGQGASNHQQHQQQHQQQSQYQQQYNLPAAPGGGGANDDTMSLSSTNAPVKSRSKMFTKTDNYFMGIAQAAVPESERVLIVPGEQTGFVWKTDRQPYTVVVDSPKKDTKFRGLKSFIAYKLTPSFTNVAVFRRYKQFDWLHERLAEKFSMIPIPPLPDKQISGRYEEQFIEHRRVQLQEFVDWMCRHPVMSHCDVWMHFLVCQDEKKWKMGKRTAEKDPLLGSMYCAAIFPPEKQLLSSQVDGPMELCNSFIQSMGGAVKTLSTVSAEQTKSYQLQWRRDFQRIGEGFSELAKALEVDERRATTSVSLSNSVGQTAGVYIGIGQLFEDQPKNDWIPLSDRLHIYKGVLTSFPYILGEQKNAVQHRRDCEKQTAEQKMSNAQLQEVIRRTDVMSYAVMAEMTHFRDERDTHLKATLREFISNQITFYQNIISRLQVAQHFFD